MALILLTGAQLTQLGKTRVLPLEGGGIITVVEPDAVIRAVNTAIDLGRITHLDGVPVVNLGHLAASNGNGKKRNDEKTPCRLGCGVLVHWKGRPAHERYNHTKQEIRKADKQKEQQL